MKKYAGINYEQRPESYWYDKDVLGALLRNVKGRLRREMIQSYWEQGRLEELDEEVLGESLSEARRVGLGRIHPRFMGGEYLPDFEPGEVEIARIELASVTADVLSVRARPVPEGIGYRVVDEYKCVFRLKRDVSRLPLTLGELVCLIDEGGRPDLLNGLALGWNDYNLDGCALDGGTRAKLRHFTRVSSRLYPQLSEHYGHVFEEWVAEGEPEPEELEVEELKLEEPEPGETEQRKRRVRKENKNDKSTRKVG